MNWSVLLKGEALMTANILFGMFIGDMTIRFGVAEKLLGRIMPLLKRVGIGPLLGVALTVSMGSSKAAAGLLARGMEEGRITREGAIWGTICLSFPAYLRRWPSTFVMCTSMTGLAGGVFASVLLLRSLGRFLFVILKARNSEASLEECPAAAGAKIHTLDWYKRLIKTLPLAWLFYAAAFTLMPFLESFLRSGLGGGLLPVAGWGVASAALAGISASLALARGSLAAGDLSAAQTVFALLLGNGLGYFTRAIRQNAGYFFGIFPAGISQSILLRSVATMLPFVAVSLLVSVLFIL